MLGPVLFILHTTLLSTDTQIFMSLSVFNAKESLEKLQHCVITVSTWITKSKLKLNPSKTDFILIGTKLQRDKILNIFPCLILDRDTNPFASAKNLGVVFDSSPDFLKYISQKTHIQYIPNM